jgi:hypothetical protein
MQFCPCPEGLLLRMQLRRAAPCAVPCSACAMHGGMMAAWGGGGSQASCTLTWLLLDRDPTPFSKAPSSNAHLFVRNFVQYVNEIARISFEI